MQEDKLREEKGEEKRVRVADTIEEVLGIPDPSLPLRAALRYSYFRLFQSTTICHPSDVDDDVDGDRSTLGWLLKQKEPKWQWSVLQLLRAAAGNQSNLQWEQEDCTQSGTNTLMQDSFQFD